MRKMKLLACVLVLALTLTGCALDSLPGVYDVEQGGADFTPGSVQTPEPSEAPSAETEAPGFSLGGIQIPDFSLGEFALSDLLSGEMKLPDISYEDFKELGSGLESLTDEEKMAKYKEYLAEVCQKALEKMDGIQDVDIDLEGLLQEGKLNVDLDFEKVVGDKEELKAKVKTILEKFFVEFEDIEIQFEEE